MLLSEYIACLQHTLYLHGDKPVEFTQSGYYCEDRFADLYTPPEVKEYDGDCREDTTFYTLGHSHQSY